MGAHLNVCVVSLEYKKWQYCGEFSHFASGLLRNHCHLTQYLQNTIRWSVKIGRGKYTFQLRRNNTVLWAFVLDKLSYLFISSVHHTIMNSTEGLTKNKRPEKSTWISVIKSQSNLHCFCDFYFMNKMSAWQLQSGSEFNYNLSTLPTSPKQNQKGIIISEAVLICRRPF